MKTIPEHIAHIRTKPHHIRKRVAFTAAGTGAGIIALIWLVGSLSSGDFALKATSFANSTEGAPVVTTSDNTNAQGLAGAAAAAQDASAPAHIEIVDVATSTAPATKAEQTTIPF